MLAAFVALRKQLRRGSKRICSTRVSPKEAQARTLTRFRENRHAATRTLEEALAQKDGHAGALEAALARENRQSVLAQERNDELDRRAQQLETDFHKAAQQKNRALLAPPPRSNKDLVRLLADLKRNDVGGRLPRQLRGWCWLALGKRKKRRRLARDYRVIAESPLFDSEWYLQRNPDVAINGEDPVLHYLLYGAREGRAPGPLFDGSAYLKANPDVASAELNPLLHYICKGRSENRRIAGGEGGRAPVMTGWGEDLSAASSLDSLTVPLPYGKALYLKRCELAVFQARTAGPICFPSQERPFFSVVISAFNKFAYNVRTLELLERAVSYANAKKGIGIEVVFIDDGSTDETARLEDYVKGVVIRRTTPNMGYLRACNFGASHAIGEYFVFVNNDVEFEPDIFVRLHDAVERDKSEVACFGAEILQLDGSIQDLGSGIWRDGVVQGYFRNEPPTRYAYAYPRDVDYVAGCFFCISAAEFRDYGGFDECFAPGYYEETDLSLRLWQAGRRSRVYPDIRLYHLEYGSFSSEAPRASLELMTKNKPIFARRHRDFLDQRPEFKRGAGYPIRLADNRLRMLFIEDRVPGRRLGSGLGRAEIIVRALLKAADVDIFSCSPEGNDAMPDGFQYIDIAYGPDVDLLEQRLARRHYDAVYVCRPHNVAGYETALRAWRRGGGSIVYDAEAVYAVREVARSERAETYAAITSSPGFDDLVAKELLPAELADVIIAVSEAEAAILRRRLNRPVLTIGHCLPVRPLGPEPAERSGVLFVGALWSKDSPNYDSLVWFLDHVWPGIIAVRPEETLRIAGYVRPEVPLGGLIRLGVTWLGPVPDLTDEYARARVFIAPTRFAAGIPFKVHEALSYGLPVVSSRLIAEQLTHEGKVDGLLSATVRDDGSEFSSACLRLLIDDDLWREKREAGLTHMKSYSASSSLDAAISSLVRSLRDGSYASLSG